MQRKYVNLNGIKIHYLENGPEVKKELGTIVFLHGFPESAYSWHSQLGYFSNDYRVIAPDLLGYNDSDKPKNPECYTVPNLIELFRNFIESVNQDNPVVLVAHDWGGAIAWPLAAFHPNLFSHLVILNAAHPSTFTREMISNPIQREKSQYIHQLIGADAELLMHKNDFEFLSIMLTNDQGQSVLSANTLQEYKARWSKSGAINGMLSYYRAMPQLAPSGNEAETAGPVINLNEMKVPKIRVDIQTLVLWGEKDKAFVPELLDGIEEYVPNIQVMRFAQASHWLQHQQPVKVNKAIEGFISRTKNSLK